MLISDLADDPNDFQRLDTVLNGYRAEGIALRVIALNADPNDVQRFKGLIGKASSIIPAGLTGPKHDARRDRRRTSFPSLLVVLAAVVAVLLRSTSSEPPGCAGGRRRRRALHYEVDPPRSRSWRS